MRSSISGLPTPAGLDSHWSRIGGRHRLEARIHRHTACVDGDRRNASQRRGAADLQRLYFSPVATASNHPVQRQDNVTDRLFRVAYPVACVALDEDQERGTQ